MTYAPPPSSKPETVFYKWMAIIAAITFLAAVLCGLLELSPTEDSPEQTQDKSKRVYEWTGD